MDKNTVKRFYGHYTGNGSFYYDRARRRLNFVAVWGQSDGPEEPDLETHFNIVSVPQPAAKAKGPPRISGISAVAYASGKKLARRIRRNRAKRRCPKCPRSLLKFFLSRRAKVSLTIGSRGRRFGKVAIRARKGINTVLLGRSTGGRRIKRRTLLSLKGRLASGHSRKRFKVRLRVARPLSPKLGPPPPPTLNEMLDDIEETEQEENEAPEWPLPDLTVTGDSNSFTVRNRGTLTAGPFTVSDVVDADPPEVATARLGGLAPGAQVTRFLHRCVSAKTLTVDLLGEVEEQSESNNVARVAC